MAKKKPANMIALKPTPLKDTQQLARAVLDAVAPVAVPAKKKPVRPPKKDDAADVDRAADEGMAQPQGTPPEKNPAAVALGRLGGLVGGKARAANLTPAKRKAIAKKAAAARWKKDDSAPAKS